MTQIYTRIQVRQAVARTMLAHPTMGQEAAMELVADTLAIPIEAVRDACECEEAA